MLKFRRAAGSVSVWRFPGALFGCGSLALPGGGGAAAYMFRLCSAADGMICPKAAGNPLSNWTAGVASTPRSYYHSIKETRQRKFYIQEVMFHANDVPLVW